jgi:hypothetical protein
MTNKTYARFQLEENLRTAAVYALTWGVMILAAVGLILLINHANVKIESRCLEQGGQVLQTPGEPSRCLLPPTR